MLILCLVLKVRTLTRMQPDLLVNSFPRTFSIRARHQLNLTISNDYTSQAGLVLFQRHCGWDICRHVNGIGYLKISYANMFLEIWFLQLLLSLSYGDDPEKEQVLTCGSLGHGRF
jgi:hypothetical protein